MDKTQIVKYLGIFVLVVMALSMAAVILSVDKYSNSTSDSTDTLPVAKDNPFDYTLTFDANAIKDLSGARVAAMTTQTNKTIIDSAVLKIEGVSKVTSQFKKTSVDSNSWVYLAEVSMKKGADLFVITKALSDLNFFDKAQGIQAMKYITIAVPSSVMIHNVDLNIDRNFSFPSTTLSALASVGTQSGDELIVTGTITVQGKVINAISLMEQQNLTKDKQLQDLTNQIQIDTNAPIDSNTASAKPIDTNTKTDSNLSK